MTMKSTDEQAVAVADQGVEVTKEMDMQELLATITSLEGKCDANMETSERKEAEKQQKKKLREVRKLVAEPGFSSDDKTKELANKCIQHIRESTKLQLQVQKQQKQLEVLKLEKDTATKEAEKSALLRERLQDLCRELQKTNKKVNEDSHRMVLEEHEKRKEMSDKFGETVKDITTRLDQQSNERVEVEKENQDLRGKLKNLLEQFDLRETHFEKQLHASNLELQLSEAKLEQQTQMNAQLEAKSQSFFAQVQLHKTTEEELRKQLDSSLGRFTEFQEALTQSNEVFGKMKQDSERQMKLVRGFEKKLKASEAEGRELKKRAEEASVALIKKMDECEQLQRKKQALEGLCRRLKEQRSSVTPGADQQEEQQEKLAAAPGDFAAPSSTPAADGADGASA